MKEFLKANGFVAWMLGLVALAYLLPEWGGGESPLPVDWIRKAGVFLIFFNQGVVLPGESLRNGVLEWKLHTLCQGMTFVVFPMLVFLLLFVFSTLLPQADVQAGFWYLAILPTTVTSAVALTSVSGGNSSGAVFNCTLSSIIGVFWIPVGAYLFLGLQGQNTGLSVTDLFAGIATTLLLPLALGQVLRSRANPWYKQHKVAVRRFNNGVILFIVWTAFCQSFLRNVWSLVSFSDIALILLSVMVLLLISSALTWGLGGRADLDPASRVTAFYCGSQKSLAVGLPVSTLLFGPESGYELSLILIPLLIYHPAQLILGGALSTRLEDWSSRQSV
jgi:sodium/bile acid cotransporter 7